MRKAACILPLLLLPLALTGCMKSVRLNDRGIVQGIAVDAGENGGYKVTMQVAGPSSKDSPDGPNEAVIVEQEGQNMTEALSGSSVAQGRQMFLGSCALLVIGPDVAVEGMNYVLDFFSANHRVNPSLTVLISKGPAGELLSASGENPQMGAEMIVDSVNAGIKAGDLGRSHLVDVLDALHNGKEACAIPVIEMVKKEEQGASSGGSGGGQEKQQFQQGGGQSTASAPEKLVFSGIAVMKGDRVVNALGMEASRGLAWVRGRTANRVMALDDRHIGRVSLVTYQQKMKLEPELVGDTAVIHARLRVHSTALEMDLRSGRRLTDEDRAHAKMLQERAVKAEIERLLDGTQKRGLDVLGAAPLMKQRYPEFYRAHEGDWGQAVHEMVYDVSVECTIDRSGVDNAAIT